MSEALRLAEWLDKCEPNFYGESSLWLDKVLADNVMYAAIELRRLHAEVTRLGIREAADVEEIGRLHAENERLREALRELCACHNEPECPAVAVALQLLQGQSDRK